MKIGSQSYIEQRIHPQIWKHISVTHQNKHKIWHSWWINYLNALYCVLQLKVLCYFLIHSISLLQNFPVRIEIAVDKPYKTNIYID